MDYLKRKIDAYLDNWFSDKNKKPLIIKGARQIGKTKSIRVFAAKHYENVIEINFIESPKFKKILEDGYGADEIVKNISRIEPGFLFVPGKTLLFFDEIQECPRAITSLKYFCENMKELHVICAGSLLGVALKEKNISFPVFSGWIGIVHH